MYVYVSASTGVCVCVCVVLSYKHLAKTLGVLVYACAVEWSDHADALSLTSNAHKPNPSQRSKPTELVSFVEQPQA